MASEPRKIVVILGNGFDLDFGLKTSYKDFWESEYCPKDYPAPLIKHLNERWGKDLDKVRWYDLENELLNYALKEDKGDVITPEEKDYLNSIKEHLSYYLAIDILHCDDQKKADVINSLIDKGYIILRDNLLRKIETPYLDDIYQPVFWRDKKALELIKDRICKYFKPIRLPVEDSNTAAFYLLLALKMTAKASHDKQKSIVGKKVLMEIKTGVVQRTAKDYINDFVYIYSFNYTRPCFRGSDIEHALVYHVHGSCEEGRIIIGTKDDQNINTEYDYLQKSMDPNYLSSPLVKDLRDADEVIIFGHSLGENDRQYFAPFFKRQSDETSDLSKKITIFTHDQQSEMETKRALQTMTDGHLSLLYSLNDLCIIKTGNIKDGSKDSQNFRDFLMNHEISEDAAEEFIKELGTKE